MTDLSHDLNHAIRSTASNTAQVASTVINSAFLLLDQKPSLKIDIQSEPLQKKSDFEADVNIAQLMAEDGKTAADIESVLEARSSSFDRATNKEAYLTAVLARADMLTVREKAKEQGIKPSLELGSAPERTPEISL